MHPEVALSDSQMQDGTTGASSIRNLREFITQNMGTVGHFEGEGECTTSRNGPRRAGLAGHGDTLWPC
ncbi:MAG: hypothetical protein GQE15_27320 [Archangiaceae bacterium]|nr:hypothetical protein [Archangiaceae bacterium]